MNRGSLEEPNYCLAFFKNKELDSPFGLILFLLIKELQAGVPSPPPFLLTWQLYEESFATTRVEEGNGTQVE